MLPPTAPPLDDKLTLDLCVCVCVVPGAYPAAKAFPVLPTASSHISGSTSSSSRSLGHSPARAPSRYVICSQRISHRAMVSSSAGQMMPRDPPRTIMQHGAPGCRRNRRTQSITSEDRRAPPGNLCSQSASSTSRLDHRRSDKRLPSELHFVGVGEHPSTSLQTLKPARMRSSIRDLVQFVTLDLHRDHALAPSPEMRRTIRCVTVRQD